MPQQHDGVTVELLGHASIRIETADGSVIYVDPWADMLDVDPIPADYVLITHDDPDHYDPDAIETVITDDTTIAAYGGVDTSNLSADVTSLSIEETYDFGDFELTTTPAYNREGGPHVDPDGNPYHATNEVIGLLLTIDGTRLWYPSDTDVLRAHHDYDVDILVPPIGGTYTMDRHEAAELAVSLQPDLVIPVHYDTFEAVETDVEAFKGELEADGISVSIL